MNRVPDGLRSLLLGAIMLLFAACTSPTGRQQAMPAFTLLAPDSIGANASVFLQVELASADEQQLLQLALDIRGRTLQLVVMDTLGRRLATLAYENNSYQLRREPGAAKNIPYRQLLGVLQMIFWPLDALNRANAGHGWEFRQQEQRRAWYNGQPYARIDARETAPWTGRYDYYNQLDDSRISLQSVPLP